MYNHIHTQRAIYSIHFRKLEHLEAWEATSEGLLAMGTGAN